MLHCIFDSPVDGENKSHQLRAFLLVENSKWKFYNEGDGQKKCLKVFQAPSDP